MEVADDQLSTPFGFEFTWPNVKETVAFNVKRGI